MTWEEKMSACAAIGEIALRMRKPGDWYVDHRGVELGDGGILESGCVSGARTPEQAIESHWLWLLSAKYPKRIVVGAYTGSRRELRWNGYMWEEEKP